MCSVRVSYKEPRSMVIDLDVVFTLVTMTSVAELMV